MLTAYECSPLMHNVPHSLRVTTAPVSEPITLTEAKAHCRVDTTDEDDLLTAYLVTAREKVESDTERALMPQTITLRLDAFPKWIELRRCPVSSGTVVITYVDTAGDTQTLSSTNYIVDQHGEPGRITPAVGYAWPSTALQINAVTVVFSAGYASAELVPAAAKHAMKLLIGHWYRNREAVGQVGSDIEMAYGALINSIRWGGYQ